jgi:hypothetical protein
MPSYFEFSNDHIKYYEFNYEEEQKISSKNVSIKDETVFLYHWQIANPAFFDKDEQWYDEYEKKDVEKIGIIKKLLQRLKKNKT